MHIPVSPSFDDLRAIVGRNYQKPDLALLERAYRFANEAHRGTMRLSGHPEITHPIAVACMLAEMRMGLTVVCAGLLHDVLEDTPRTYEELSEAFGADIADLVRSVTKLQKAQYRGMDRYLENHRRMFLAMAQDMRAVMIKFCDRLHNLETVAALPRDEQLRIAREAIEVHAAIAARLCMGEMRGDLENLAFRVVDPEGYERTRLLVETNLARQERYTARVIASIRRALKAEAGIEARSIHGRVKRIYSLYRKLQRYHGDLSRVHDLVAVRIIVPKLEDCYVALGILHKRWRPLKGRIKDYIAQPKPNGYQSLHTTVFCEDGQIVEFQIRTAQMHENAEYGRAAYWRYKDTAVHVPNDQRWVEELAVIQRQITERSAFHDQLESLKLDVFRDRIFVFTPKGEVIDLPEGATPVDFAYAIHTDIGNKCVSARVNGETVGLDTQLKSHDLCEIITDPKRKGPSSEWLRFVKTRLARERIRETARRDVGGWLHAVVSGRAQKR